jgi:MFS transporter, ACS family, tartrate transporter
MDGAIEKSAMRKVYMRLLPFAILSYFLAYIDRINVSFAGLTMRGDLEMSATAFGLRIPRMSPADSEMMSPGDTR